MSSQAVSQIYDIKHIDHYDRFINASIMRDYRERSIMGICVLLSCCGLISQVQEQNEDNRTIIMTSLVMMTGLYAVHRINKIFRHTIVNKTFSRL
ncbi:MAG: hypothetical protein EB053_07105 [Chlamydiae bacterium]|nr:hypothetical protein [Chlamydiota bacterium]